jgi:aflatoxin B1 aldehyde reductase
MYLHGPDRTTPFAETFEAVDKEYRAGCFEEFGLSNFSAAEVEECIAMCKEKGWVLPTVYQGQYNAITRGGEKDLMPVLRKHGIRFNAFT